jgi:serine/threonine protein kinase/ketosteroid isomerase-like protein
MKLCPVCNRCFEDHEQNCSEDQTPLLVARHGGRLIEEKYRLDRLLVEGGMGTVYVGTQVSLKRPVALKLLLPALTANPDVLNRFQREAMAAARVSHPNLAEIYDYGTLADGGAYIVMEFIDGPTLRDYLKVRPQLPFEEAVHLARQIAEGMAAAHEAGIVHRDLKPSNIILKQRGMPNAPLQVKIVDFGIAKFIGPAETSDTTLTATGTLVGTPRYMSPEQCYGETIDVRSDIYSLGIITYEMLAGQPPLDAPSETAIVLKQTQEPPPPIQDFRPQIPRAFAHLIMQSLEKNPARRPQTAIDVVARLHEVVQALAHANWARQTSSAEQGWPEQPEAAHAALPFVAEEPLGPSADLRTRDLVAAPTRPTQETAALALDEQQSQVSPAPVTNARLDIPLNGPDNEHNQAVTHVRKRAQAYRRRLWLAATALLAALGLGLWAWSSQRAAQPESGLLATTEPTASPASVVATPKVKPTASPLPSPPLVTATVEPPAPEDLEADRQVLNESLDQWIAATNASDIEQQMAFYVPQVETFYLTRNVRREAVRAEKARLFRDAEVVEVRARNPSITFSPDGQTAMMRFRKSYSIQGSETREGEVLQELRWRKTENGWRIISERDLKVFR